MLLSSGGKWCFLGNVVGIVGVLYGEKKKFDFILFKKLIVCELLI